MSSSSVRAAVSPGPAHEQSRPPLTGPELLGVLDDVDDPEHVHRALEGGLGVVSTSRGRVVGGGVWIVASGKIKFEASSLFCAVLRLVITPFSGQRLSADLVLSCRVIRVLLTVYLGYARKYAK